MKEKLNILNSEEVESLKQDYEVLTFPNDFDLVYENQIPSTGVALIKGQIELIKKSRPTQLIEENCLLGIKQLLDEQPVRLGCRIKSNSQIVLLGKSEIFSLLKNKDSKLFNVIKSLKLNK